jgi:lysozyme family protein
MMAPIVQPINKAQPNVQDPAVLGLLQQQGFANQSADWWASYFNGVQQQNLQLGNISQPASLPYPYDNLQTAALGALAQNVKQSMGQWMQGVGSQVKTGLQQLSMPANPAIQLSLNNTQPETFVLPAVEAVPTTPPLSTAPLPTVLANPETDYTLTPQLALSTNQSSETGTPPRQAMDLGMPPSLQQSAFMPQNTTVQLSSGYMNMGVSSPASPSSTASLLASAFPPPTLNSGLTAVQTMVNNNSTYSAMPNYTANNLIQPVTTSNNTIQQLMNQNLALSQEGSALSLYLQQVQQVLNTQRPMQDPVFAAPAMNQPKPTIVSATPTPSAVSSNTEKPSTKNTSVAAMPTESTTNTPRAEKYEALLKTLKPELSGKQQASLTKFEQIFAKNKGKYEAVAKRLGVPDNLVEMSAKAIWAIHCREGSADFTTYLHNGQKLGKPTTLVPAGISFDNWEDAAVDAIKRELPKVGGKVPQSLPDWLSFSEAYNGLGYENKGVPSPYVLAGTTAYQKGKYVADGKYDANHVDQQLGVAVLLTS